MNPKKAKSFIEEISKEINEDKELLESIIDFYYAECRSELSNLKHVRLNIEGLGHFVSRHNLIKKAIDKHTKDLINHDTSTFTAYYNKKNLENKLELLKNLQVLHKEEFERKKEFKKTKNEFKEDLGEQKKDL